MKLLSRYYISVFENRIAERMSFMFAKHWTRFKDNFISLNFINLRLTFVYCQQKV